MKKIYSLALVLALLLSLSTPALADTTLKDPDESASIPVTGYYYSGTSNDVVYSVDIAWSNMNFSYDGGDKTWNPDTHDYTGGGGEGQWQDSNAQITVTNHSNAFLTLKCAYVPIQEYSSAYLDFAYPLCTPKTDWGLLYSAEIDGLAQKAVISVTPDGTLPENTPANTPIGNITLTIAQWSPTVKEAEEFADTATGALSDYAETHADNELYSAAQTAVGRLYDAVTAVSSSGTNENHLSMTMAYLDAYAAMADFEAQLEQTT